jgi:hypothetical protein
MVTCKGVGIKDKIFNHMCVRVINIWRVHGLTLDVFIMYLLNIPSIILRV